MEEIKIDDLVKWTNPHYNLIIRVTGIRSDSSFVGVVVESDNDRYKVGHKDGSWLCLSFSVIEDPMETLLKELDKLEDKYGSV